MGFTCALMLIYLSCCLLFALFELCLGFTLDIALLTFVLLLNIVWVFDFELLWRCLIAYYGFGICVFKCFCRCLY